MDPNNNSNQPINLNPFGQPIAPQQGVSQPVAALPTDPVFTPNIAPPPAPVSTPMMPEAPKSGGKKGIAMIIILLILAAGMAFYVFFFKNQMNNVQKTSTQNTSVVIPTVTPTVVPATVDQINVASPDADLKSIENDVQGL